jgi:hypothetical protein
MMDSYTFKYYKLKTMYKYVVLKSLPSGRVISRTNSAETLKKLNEFSKKTSNHT